MNKVIKNAENMLQERFLIAVQTDENMGNKDGKDFYQIMQTIYIT